MRLQWTRSRDTVTIFSHDRPSKRLAAKSTTTTDDNELDGETDILRNPTVYLPQWWSDDFMMAEHSNVSWP